MCKYVTLGFLEILKIRPNLRPNLKVFKKKHLRNYRAQKILEKQDKMNMRTRYKIMLIITSPRKTRSLEIEPQKSKHVGTVHQRSYCWTKTTTNQLIFGA
jgi:hypothetical protein